MKNYKINLDKENIKSTTFLDRSNLNTGKSIKSKALVSHCINSSVCLREIPSSLKKFPQLQFFSSKVQDQFDGFDSISCSNIVIDLQKQKSVRFEDELNDDGTSQSSITLIKGKYPNKLNKKPSILKKNSSCDKLSVKSYTSDVGTINYLTPKSSLKDKGGKCQNCKKYHQTVSMLKYQNKKFFDDLFPPGGASLFHSKNRAKQFEEIRWMRIQEVFKGKKLILFGEKNIEKSMICPGALFQQEMMEIAQALNAFNGSSRCLERIFENQKLFGLSIYFLRMNSDGIWKYVLIDDYIPVVQKGNQYLPAFLKVYENQEGKIQIWPYLLQKCMAKIYGSYECLLNDSIESLLCELTGINLLELDLKQESSEYKFRTNFLNSQSICVISDPYSSNFFKQNYYPLRQENPSSQLNLFFNFETKVRLIDMQKKSNIIMEFTDLKKQFRKVKIYKMDDTFCSMGCIIKQNKNTFSLRKFTISERQTSCVFSLIQKDKKHYRNNGYEYVWTRMMLVMKEKSGYRWINGNYCKGKVSSINCLLEPAEYFLIINGDWKNRAYEMNLNFQGNNQIKLSRQPMENHEKIVHQVCMDYAQRFGELKQVTKNLCSYRCIDLKNGFIIQNFNNETNRQVFLHKFYPHLDQLLKNQKEKKFELIDGSKRQIFPEENSCFVELMVPADSHFTFIIKLVDGVDRNLIQAFKLDY